MRHLSRQRFFWIVRVPVWGVLLVGIWVVVFSKRGFLDLRQVQGQIQSLQEERFRAEREKEAISIRIHEFQTSKTAQEKTIREILGYVKPDEKLIEFD